MIFYKRHPLLAINVRSRLRRIAAVSLCTLLLGFLAVRPTQLLADEAQPASESAETETEAETEAKSETENQEPAETTDESTETAEEQPEQESEESTTDTEPPAEETEKKTETEQEEKPAETEEPASEAMPAESPATEAPAEAPVNEETGRTVLKPDDGGRIQFSYIGQPWDEVLQDFADASGNSLDWQELPEDTLNLTTQHLYTIQEARDLLNRHLLARGFTMLSEGEVLTVVKVDKLDPSLIPRATPDELENFPPHDFMRITFKVPLSMETAKAAEDAKVLLSPNAKITPLLASKRLLVIDAVTNLRDVRNLLYSERSAEETSIKPREFMLKHRRAEWVADQVMIVLGLDPKSRKTPAELALETKRLDMQMKMLEKDKDIGKLLKKDGPEVFIAVNVRQNSILVNAAPELMMTIEQTVKQLDVPDDAPEGNMALTLHQYELVSASPKEVISALENNVNLDPRSRLQGDAKNRTLLATATAVDHAKIREIIGKLDATVLPIVEAANLQDSEPNSFVRVRFQLPFSMNPTTIAAKVQPLLSSKGTVTPLQASRRLLVVGSVENLLEVRELLQAEELALKSQEDIREFPIKHRLAAEMAQQILSMLEGVSPAALSNPQGMRFDVQGMTMFMALNENRNSLRIGAHPELIKMIEQIIKQFDIDESAVAADGKIVPQTMVLYKIVGQDISGMIIMLRDLGGVEPLTRLQPGPASETLYAIATKEQHGKIRQFLDKMAPNKLPRVELDQLEQYQSSEIVRVRFQLPLSFNIAQATVQIQPFLSPRGVVKSLTSSNQLIIDDAVENLIEIREILRAEQAAIESQEDIREFVVKHLRADEMAQQVLTMLELNPASITNPRGVRLSYQGMKLFIAINEPRNSLRIGAHPELVKMIEQIIKQFDIEESVVAAEGENPQTMVLYRVPGQNIVAVIAMLRDLGEINPVTRLQAGPATETLYAIATKDEHEKIRKFLDKTAPNQLPRVEPDQLEKHQGSEIVRVRFQLPLSYSIVEASAQVRVFLSPRGVVKLLPASNQIIVDDAVESLIEIRDILRTEQAAIESQEDIREFVIKHLQADEMAQQVLTMLELNPASITNPLGVRLSYRGMKFFIAVNQQRNSIQLGANPELVKMVEMIIKQFDVADSPEDGAVPQTMVLYKVPGQNVVAVIAMLSDLGDLGPVTRLQAGPAAETLYAIATPEEHGKIRQFLEKIAPNQIPRVEADKLDDHPATDVVRVRFQLPLETDINQAAVQIRGILGPQGLVQPLASSKQLIIVDTVANLREIRDVLQAEAVALKAQENIREFPLQHRRAEEMVGEVLTMLGLDPKTITYPQELRIELRLMKLFITANQQRNSILVNASKDKLKKVEEIIKQLDVPQAKTAAGDPSHQTMVPYKVAGRDVNALVTTIMDIEDLDPRTKITGDPYSQTLYAYAIKADHEKIRKFVEKIDPNSIQRVDADKLGEHQPHELARVRFQLPLSADVLQAATQIRGLLSTTGKVQSLVSSRQLIVDDTIANLIDVRDVLLAEKQAMAAQEQIHEFVLQHVRAEQMAKQVLTMLGLSPSTLTTPEGMRYDLRGMKLFLSIKAKRNALLISTHPELLEVIKPIIKQFDVADAPVEGAVPQAMVLYKVPGQNVLSVIEMLNELGELSPQVRLQAGPATETLYAIATQEEHGKIRQFLDKIAPPQIPNLEADKLEEHPLYETARVRFQLPITVDITQLAAQITSIVAPSGKVQSLELSKQLIVVDTVANLIEVREILRAELAAHESQENIREFALKYRRADEMVEQVLTMLGLDPASMRNPQELRLELQRLKLFITANESRNSLIINAPAERMGIVEEIIKQLDVPQEAGAEGAKALTMLPYKVEDQDLDSVIKTLQEIGDLGPYTRLQSDPVSRTIYAFASKEDHEKISDFLDKTAPESLLRVLPEALEEHPLRELARVRFELPLMMDVGQAATQIRGILGPKGKVQLLASSRQLIVDDTVANLIDIRNILRAETASLENTEDIREFAIVHRRAEEMFEQVLTMLGLDPATMRNPQELRQELQALQLFITTNVQRNSLVVSAPADKMAKVEKIIKQLDVPEAGPNGTPTAGELTMVPYKVATQNVESVVKALMDIGNLDPRTRLQGDPLSKTLYAYASKTDHEKIVKFIEKTDPNLVRRVEADKLEEYPATEVLRVRFQLPKVADMTLATNQVKGLLGLGGKVQSLEASRQLIVVDTASNLIEVREILLAESSALENMEDIREFAIVHRRAEEMFEQVLTMLGLDPAAMRNPQELRQELQALKLFITTNVQRNSLVVNASADKMAKVEKIIKQLDVPEAGPNGTPAAGELTMVPYKVATQNVDSVVKALMDIGNLDPRTRLQGDPLSKTLYAYASKSDHEKIVKFIEKTDPNLVRRVEADKLEEYPATEVLRVRFQLPKAANVGQATNQVKGLLGLGGKVQALEASRQIIVVDTATNLIEVREVLLAEKAAIESQNNIREFRLQHRRSDEMLEQVLTMLGLDPEAMRNPQELRRELQALKLFITANAQRNSLVVNAPADKMHTVEQLIKQLDVLDGEPVAVDTSRQTMVTYKLKTQDVASVIKTLKEIGNLEPRTRLQGDLLGKTLHVFAGKRDHEKIRRFIDETDPSLVRRVAPDDLEDSPSHDVVRVLFQLPLSSDMLSASEQIKGILGEQARVQSLESSKQLVVVDTVSNLIDVRDVLYAEQMAAEAHKMPRVFPLQYRRATYVVEQVMILLGLDPSARKTTSEMQFEVQRMQMMMQEAGMRGGTVSKLDTNVYIAVNRRQNSLLVNGPPEKMPLIERAIEQIDVPTGGDRPVDPGPLTMEKYQTVTASAEGIIRALEEIGNLDPKTQLQSDSTGKTIYASATPSDHVTIKKMIDKLDGSGRSSKVRWLPRRLPADQVAGSIMALIVGPEKKKEKRRRPWYYYGYGDEEEEDKLNEGFRVLPDIDNNRLLLWANDVEMVEVDNLIDKLSDNSNNAYADYRKVRRLEVRDPEATRKLLEQLQKTWSGNNKLEIEASPPKAEPKNEPKAESEKPDEEKKPNDDKQTSTDFGYPLRYRWLAQVAADPVEEESQAKTAAAQPTVESNETKAAPPIKITINAKGEIVLSSEDTTALDELEGLIEHLSPLQTEFHSFQLNYIHVLDIVYNLEIYFKDELAEEAGESFRDWFGQVRDTRPDPAPITLGKRPPLRFIDDIRSNTLIVANANANQLTVIKEIIDLYDRPPNPDLYLHRKTEAIKIKYSQASNIANSLKDVYRDLLSTKDKEFQDKEGKQSLSSLGTDKPYVFGDARRSVKGSEGPVLVRFSGALSIGIDELSNSLIVSARKEVLEEVKKTILELDEAAKPETVVRVHLADGILNADDLQGIIANALAEPWIGGKPGKKSSSSRSRSSRSRKNRRSATPAP
ncbi:MAG: hypothetical protein GXP26_12500 [Planctomycetes bacterium]|nr:hypothetical protein [Planctomycetota bacterium]